VRRHGRVVGNGLMALVLIGHSSAGQRGRIVTATVHATSLANRLGARSETRVSVYLPPSYHIASRTRYPVVYLLHGYNSSDIEWTAPAPGGRDIRTMMDSLIASHAVKELIIVMPNGSNRVGGSPYVNSSTTGNWDDFISQDLVAYVDRTYRTIARPASRGIAGASMGGHGAFYLSMRHGGTIFGAMYAMSACCSARASFLEATNLPVMVKAAWDTLASLPSLARLDHASLYVRLIATLSAAYTPDSARPPLYLDDAVERHGEQWDANASVVAKWDDHTPLFMVSTHRTELLRMRAIGFDVGAQDEAVPPTELMAMDTALTRARIPHTFEIYEGTHTSGITTRLAVRVLPFFSRMLVFGGGTQ
jgi:S-formylglutathione hydrolase